MRKSSHSEEDTRQEFFANESNVEKNDTIIPQEDDDVNEKEEETVKMFPESPIKLMPTLPATFKSLAEIPINITNENKNAKYIIRLLGTALGISDYETNMASFWFLDFIALQVLLFQNSLDEHAQSIMVSWLAGEMKLIRDNHFSHEAFWRYMETIFFETAEKISAGEPLLHWDLAHEKISKKALNIAKETMEEKLEVEQSKALPKSQSHHKEISMKNGSQQITKALQKIKIDETKMVDFEKNNNSYKNPDDILDIIIVATHSMYGDKFHYALIIAAFVEPVPLHDYNLPFSLRVPRPLKMYEIEKNVKDQNSVPSRKGKDSKKKKSNDKKTKKSQDSDKIEVRQPIELLTDEEILRKKRQYILPLMEANEASSILDNYKQTRTK